MKINSNINVDLLPKAGNNFYRLCFVDRNNKLSYTTIVHADLGTQVQSSIFPNPVSGDVFYVNTVTEKPIMIKVITIDGRLQFSQQFSGQTKYIVRLPALPKRQMLLVQIISDHSVENFDLLNLR